MKSNKIIASFLAALMTVITIVYPVIATPLSQYPSFLGSNGVLNTKVVVGSGAAASDVAGAIDIAANLASLSYTTAPTSSSGVVTPAGFNGITKNTININFGNLTGDSSSFPNPIGNAQFSGLQTSTFTYQSSTYNYHEDLNFNASGTRPYFSHDFATNYINGTETLVVPANTIAYEYVFDTALICNTTAAGTTYACTPSSPDYTYPVNINLLGVPFEIVGVAPGEVTMLSGTVGTATATTGVASPVGNYTIYSDLGANGASGSSGWADVIVKDSSGNTVGKEVIDAGSSYTFTNLGITVQVTSVDALQDGTIVGTNIVVGLPGQTTINYYTGCSIGGTGSSDVNFPGQANWCIQPGNNKYSGSASFSNGVINAGDVIQVVYKPSSTQYFQYLGSPITLPFPNNYVTLGFTGFNYNTFATLTFKYLSPTSVFFGTSSGTTNGTTVPDTSVSGIEVDSSVPGTLVGPNGVGFSKVYYLFNTTGGGPGYNSASNGNTVMWGFWDSSNSRIGVDLSDGLSTGAFAGNNGTYFADLANPGVVSTPTSWTFNTTISYGDAASATDQQVLYVTMTTSGLSQGDINTVGDYFTHFAILPSATSIYSQAVGTSDCAALGGSTQCGLLLNFMNTTTWTSSTGPTFQLYNSGSPQTQDVESVQTPAGGNAGARYSDIGQAVQNVNDNGGTIVVSPDSSVNQVQVNVPAQTLDVNAYIGSTGVSTSTTTSGSGVHVVTPVTTPLAALDTEVVSNGAVIAPYNTMGLVLVGGPCINEATALAMNLTYPACGSASGIASGTALIQAVSNFPGPGLTSVVVAGYDAPNTRTAADVLQQYSTLLSGISNSAVTVTAANAAGITPVPGS